MKEKVEQIIPQSMNLEPRKELSEEDKIIAQSFENIPWEDRRSKLDFILVWQKCKSATKIYFSTDISDEELKKVKEIIEKVGLFFQDTGIKENQIYPLRIEKNQRTCFVANNQNDLDLFSKLWFQNHETEEVYREIGRMSGFPKTSIEVFGKIMSTSLEERAKIQEQLVLSPVEKTKLIPYDLLTFSLFFYMSREHWKDELEIVRKWAEVIKMTDLELYESFIGRDGGKWIRKQKNNYEIRNKKIF